MKSKTVVYVDDDEDDRDIFFEVLRSVRPDLDLVLAKDGQDALLKLGTIHRPLCIYVDMNMPKMNGLQLLDSIKRNPDLFNIPVVILTTALTPGQTKEIKSIGASDYLIKPSSFDDFKKLLDRSISAVCEG